jgi:hypothetical protein
MASNIKESIIYYFTRILDKHQKGIWNLFNFRKASRKYPI